MSIAYCKDCLERIDQCECDNPSGEIVYNDYGLAIATCIKKLKDRGLNDAAEILEELLV